MRITRPSNKELLYITLATVFTACVVLATVAVWEVDQPEDTTITDCGEREQLIASSLMGCIEYTEELALVINCASAWICEHTKFQHPLNTHPDCVEAREIAPQDECDAVFDKHKAPKLGPTFLGNNPLSHAGVSLRE